MDTSLEPSIVVHRKDETKMKFMKYKTGLYYYEALVRSDKINKQLTDYCFATTVLQNKMMFTRREIKAADKAKEFHSLIGRPGYDRFEKL